MNLRPPGLPFPNDVRGAQLVPAQSSDTCMARSARGLWRAGRRNHQRDVAGNTRHPVNVPVASTHDGSLVT